VVQPGGPDDRLTTVHWLLLITLVASACSAEPAPSANSTERRATVQPSEPDHAPTLADLRNHLAAGGFACAELEHTNPDVPPGTSLVCDVTIDSGILHIESTYSPDVELQRVHATFLPTEPGDTLAMESQVEGLRTVTEIRYPGTDPEQALTRLVSDLASPECRGHNCITPIGTGIFYLQTGVGGAWVLSLGVTPAE
jgi:hypothetical protein